MLRRLPLALVALLPQCSFDQAESGDLCIYTARSDAQIRREIVNFVDAHPGIRLRCPEIHTKEDLVEDLVCEFDNGAKCDGNSWEVFHQSTGTLTATIEAQQGDAIPADVLWGVAVSHVMYLDNLPGERFRPYAPEHYDRVKGHVDQASTGNNTFWSWFIETALVGVTREYPKWVGIDAFTVVLCVNTEKLADRLGPPDAASTFDPNDLENIEWTDLLDPRLTGRIAAPQANRAGTGFAMLADEMGGLYPRCMDDDEPGCAQWQRLDELDDQIAIYTKSGDLPCQLAAMHDSPILIGITHDGADFLRNDRVEGFAPEGTYDDHSKMQRVFPRSHGEIVTGFDVAVNALVEHDEIEPAAHTFLDWATGPDAMRVYRESTPLIAYLTDNTLTPEGFPDLDVFELDLRSAARNMSALKANWNHRYCPVEPHVTDHRPMHPIDEARGVSSITDCLHALKSYDPEGQRSLDPMHRCASYERPLE